MRDKNSLVTRRRFLGSALGGSIGGYLLGTHSSRSSVAQATSTSPKTDWPQYQFNGGNSGYNPQGTAPVRWFTRDWHKNVDGLSGAPAVSDQTVYAPVRLATPGDEIPARHVLLALDATDGSVLWRAEMEGESSVGVVDGTVYLADRRTRALDSTDGTEQWSVQRGSYHPVVTDRFVYVTEGVEECLAINRQDGSVQWSAAFRATQIPAVDGETVYAGAEDGTVRALTATAGERRWTNSLDDSNPDLAAADGMAYAAAVEGFYALDGTSGDVQWTIPSQRTPDSSYRYNVSLPVLADGTVYVVVDGVLRAVTADSGTEQWRYDSPHEVPSVPPVRVGNAIYFVAAPNRVVALHALTGNRLGAYTAPVDRLESAVVPATGDLYVGGDAEQSQQSGLFKICGQPL
ncbi:PQQ-binding-like beta-propeller repeat protein [Halocatena halophila]|uniref:PQQ-binding-like beta-propeller repeat protein n=1 Tax=Halocatena halophila TaxID=2814576 RepID=UPI002ED56724